MQPRGLPRENEEDAQLSGFPSFARHLGLRSLHLVNESATFQGHRFPNGARTERAAEHRRWRRVNNRVCGNCVVTECKTPVQPEVKQMLKFQ